ncbi:MAG: hypothetical protein Q8L60_10035 [Gammaproteobacteria bacterium]|nr:hypothetical protein [Gammaproteobacteria bacterium]MDP2346441.1 hypothetical protein [Gammaproteobacteria bacterium]
MLNKALVDTLSQIGEIVDLVRELPNDVRSGVYIDNEVGLHVRHVMDHLQAFLTGLATGEVDYNVRRRRSLCETDPAIASEQLNSLIKKLTELRTPKVDLFVVSEIDCFSTRSERFQSNAGREMLYLINHTIHHAAYIRLLLRGSGLALPAHIGVAPCTATFHRGAHAPLQGAH